MIETRRFTPWALAAAAFLAGATWAQDSTAIPAMAISGSYRLSSVSIGANEVSMEFTASLFNPGARDVEGEVVLRNPAVAEDVWGDFGEMTIPARGRARVSAVVSVPRAIYDSWSTGSAPAVFVNIENDRGSTAMHRVSLSRVPERPSPS